MARLYFQTELAASVPTPATGMVRGFWDGTSGTIPFPLTVKFSDSSTQVMAYDGLVVHLAGTETITGVKTFTSGLTTEFTSTSGLTGATTSTRWVGGVSGSAPTSGTFSTGDHVVDVLGTIWICTAGGSPGTWVSLLKTGSAVTSVGATGPITSSGGSTPTIALNYDGVTLDNSGSGSSLEIKNGGVTLAKMANLTGPAFLGQQTGTAAPAALTPTQATAMLNPATGSLQGALSSTLYTALTGVLNTPTAIAPSGLTGATSASRHVGATTSGAPTSGTWNVGDVDVDQGGQFWIYTGNGWMPINSMGIGFYNVQNYGIYPSNSASTNSTAIAALITLATTGSVLWWPLGTYQVYSAISPGAKFFIFAGAGQNSSIIQTTSATADIVTLTDGNWYTEFRDLGFSTSVNKTAGNCITTGTASGGGNVGVNVRRCSFNGNTTGPLNLYNCIVYAGTQSGNITNVEDCTFTNFSNYGIYIEGNTSTPTTAANIQISNILMNGALASGNAVAGLYILQCGSCLMTNSDIIGCTNNVLLGGSSATSSGVFSFNPVNCYFDESFGSCVLFQGTCNIERCPFVNCWMTTAAGAGGYSAVQSTNTSTIGLTGNSFTDCHVFNTYGTTGTTYGYNLTGCQDVVITGGCVAGWTNGVVVTPYSANGYTSIKLNKMTVGPIGNIGANTNGVTLNAGSFTYKNIFIDSDLSGNSTANLIDNSTGAVAKVIPSQPGLVVAPPAVIARQTLVGVAATQVFVTGSAMSLPLGSVQPGETWEVVVAFSTTTLVAQTTTWALGIGTSSTAVNAAVLTQSAAFSGAAIACTGAEMRARITFRTIGSSGTCVGHFKLNASPATAMKVAGDDCIIGTPAAFNLTTAGLYISVSVAISTTTTTLLIDEVKWSKVL